MYDSLLLKSAKVSEPRHVKTGLLSLRKQKAQISCAVTTQLISAFVSATRLVKFPFYLYPIFQDSSFLQLVCVGPGRKTRRPVFSSRGLSCRPISP